MFAETAGGRWQSQRRAPEMREAAGEGSFSLQRGRLRWSHGELHPSTTCKAWRRHNPATLRSAKAKEKELQPQVPSREFSISRRKNVFRSWSWWAQAPLSGEPADLQQCRSCSPACTSPESRGPARLTSQGHLQPRAFQDSRRALTSGDAHKGRKKLTWQLRNQPLFIFSQTWIAFKGPGKLFHAKINTQPKIPI